MEYSFDKILDDIQKDNFKIFEVSSFKSKKKIKDEILANMPDYDLYLSNKNESSSPGFLPSTATLPIAQP